MALQCPVFSLSEASLLARQPAISPINKTLVTILVISMIVFEKRKNARNDLQFENMYEFRAIALHSIDLTHV